MTIRINAVLLSLVSILISLPVTATTITYSPFGLYGEGGANNGQAFTIGSGGSVTEVDAFINIAGEDLNGGFFGTSAQFAFDPLPTGFDYLFASSLSADATDLQLSYTFTNNTGALITGLSFFSYFDAEIDEPTNTFFNEYGVTSGVAGITSLDPSSWEIDDPGFGDIYDNLLLGSLDNANGVPSQLPGDVAFALDFDLGSLGLFETTTVDILISGDGDSIGSVALSQFDNHTSTTTITYSGQIRAPVTVSEPSTLLLFMAALLGFAAIRARFA